MNDIKLPTYQLPLVREVGFMLDEHGVLYHPHRKLKDINVFIFVIKGRIEVIEDGNAHILLGGSYLFLRKNVIHWGASPYIPGTSWYYIHFYDPPIEIAPLDDYHNFQQTSLIAKDTYHQQLNLPKKGQVTQPDFYTLQLDKLVEQDKSQDEIRPLMLSQMTYTLFINLYKDSKESKVHPRTERIIAQLTKICRQTTKKLSAEEISQAMDMNYAYVSTIFRKETGKSITQFQNEILIEKAMNLFKTELINVSEVSDKLGFSNAFYFSRVFKKVTGMAPSVYLNQNYQITHKK
ncbi:helix-turn-helix domain-containing protein [Paraliobacillus sediminis]|uniref:helix-turn-helix domain-containing protein n=1 Tax=Paraliobacillus sediminis TaxID=1885916 RepID=UPI0013C2F5E6|nr:helix-turn-helix domain-containing protein [Paraliobacillus sediminis]